MTEALDEKVAAVLTAGEPEPGQEPATDTPPEATEGISEATESQGAAEEPAAEPSGLEKALAAERKERKALEAEVKKMRAAQEEAARANLPEQERLLAEAKAAGYAEAEEKFNRQLFEARVVGAANAMQFHDPALAANLLDIEVTATEAEVAEALAALADARPYLVKAQAAPVAQPVAQGFRGGPTIESPDDWLRGAVYNR